MKRILPILILFSLLCVEGYAQRVLIDSTYYVTSGNSGNLIRATKNIYTRSSDNLIDEVKEYVLNEEKGTYSGWSRSRFTYDESGRRTSEARWDGISGDFDYRNSKNHQIFEYTDFGELAMSYYMKNFMGERIQSDTSLYYYTGTRLDSIVATKHNETNNNYILNFKYLYSYKKEYYEELHQSYNFDLNRLEDKFKSRCYEKDGKLIKSENTYFDNGIWIESGHTDYEYNETGYSYTNYERSIPSTKDEYIFDEHGQEISHKFFLWYARGEYWQLNTHWQTTIFYSEGFTDNQEITPNNIRIYSLKNSNSITIDSDISTNLSIYSLSGRLIANKSINLGLNDILVNKGVYIIKCANISKKILVQ